MKIAFFYHSLISDWNNGNAHFLRGVVSELLARGHECLVLEPAGAWSVQNLIREQGARALRAFHQIYPHLSSTTYRKDRLDLDRMLEDVELVLVHEWNDPDLIRGIGEHRRKRGRYRLLFHDTHHRSVTSPAFFEQNILCDYDGVLAYGEAIREQYVRNGWAHQIWTWHEAADTRVFHPLPGAGKWGDVVWIGNWGDEERTAEFEEIFIRPVQAAGLTACAHGVRYPEQAIKRLRAAGIFYGGWLANYHVPKVYARYRLTVHIPRKPYRINLPGIPTIRPFEALACGIPLISMHWEDREHLFNPGRDYLVVRNGEKMKAALRLLTCEPQAAAELSAHGLQTILARHTCAHRVEQLIGISRLLGIDTGRQPLKTHSKEKLKG